MNTSRRFGQATQSLRGPMSRKRNRLARLGRSTFIFAVVTAGAFLFANPVFATEWTVTSTDDTDTLGTLRYALGNAVDGDTILFDLTTFPSATPATITVTSTALPSITQGNLTIDASPNAGGVIISGSGLGSGIDGLTLASTGNTIKGLKIASFPDYGVVISSGDNTIGGTGANEGNMIYSNGSVDSTSGILFQAATGTTTILGNYIGTNASYADLGNTRYGIYVNGQGTLTIGGTTAGSANTIAWQDWIGGQGAGIYVNDGSPTIQGNYLSTNASGATNGENFNNIVVASGGDSVTIGGTAAGAGNTIAGGNSAAIQILSSGTTNVQGNYFGLNSSWTDLVNPTTGIYINALGTINIGGTAAGAGNWIGFFDVTGTINGIAVSNGSPTIQGNYIGTNASGADLGNGIGIGLLVNADAVTIGGTASGAGNTIGMNDGDGINNASTNTSITIRGNYIGTDSGGSSLPNAGDGIDTTAGTITIGNVSETVSNVIGPNTGYGINMPSGTPTVNFAGTVFISDDVNFVAGTVGLGSAIVNIGGNWTNGGATITPGSSTVVLTGTSTPQVVSGSTSFNNLTINKNNSPTINFTSGTTQTIGGTFTSAGDATHQITIGATSGSTAALSKSSGTVSVSYTTISYSEATGGATWLAYLTNGNTDGGNNSGWDFTDAPTLTTDAASSVATSTVTLNGSITATGGADATESGFVYGTDSALSTVIATSTLGGQTGTASFTEDLTSLTPGTAYYFRAYATNSAGTGYGSIETFSTDAVVVPTVSASSATSITTTSATLNGSIDDTGGDSATARGFEWGTDTSYGTIVSSSGSYGTGAFTTDLTSLTCNNSYHFRSFATNSAGTASSTDVSFSTSACPVSSTPAPVPTGGNGPIFGGGVFLPNIPSARPQIVYPDGQVVYVDTAPVENQPILPPNLLTDLFNGLFQNTPEETQPATSLEPQATLTEDKLVSTALDQSWNLLSPETVGEFLLTPLPSKLLDLVRKFPELGTVFSKLGVAKISDLSKLQSVSMSLPTVTELKDLPRGIVVANGGGGNIGVTSSITLDEAGVVEQKIQTVANTSLTLAVKPSFPVDAVTGYLVFRESAKKTVAELPLDLYAASAVLAFQGRSSGSVIPDRELLIQTFVYEDVDRDGVYTADITTPAVEGTYEVITLISYRDKSLGTRELRLVTVIDPEGYVFERIGGKEARIPDASVSIFNADDGTFWDSVSYNQENPQVTDTSGKYAFLVPEGRYYITAEASGYVPYRSQVFTVREGSGIHFNIELRSSGWLAGLDWKTTSLILLILVLGSAFAGYALHEHALKKELFKQRM